MSYYLIILMKLKTYLNIRNWRDEYTKMDIKIRAFDKCQTKILSIAVNYSPVQ